MIGFCHDRRLAGDWITNDAKTILGSDDKGEEPVEILKAAFQCFAQRCTVLHFPCEVGGTDLCVVLGFDMDAFAAQLAAQRVVVGQRTIVHQTLIGARVEGMSAHGRDSRFRRHTRMSNAMCARHFGKLKPGRHIFGQTDFFVDFETVAKTHHADAHFVQSSTHLSR